MILVQPQPLSGFRRLPTGARKAWECMVVQLECLHKLNGAQCAKNAMLAHFRVLSRAAEQYWCVHSPSPASVGSLGDPGRLESERLSCWKRLHRLNMPKSAKSDQNEIQFSRRI